MSKYLTTVVETYRVDSEAEANALIEEAKSDGHFILKKYSTEHKERKSKGEIIDEYEKVIFTKLFNDEKEPSDNSIEISYE